MHCPHASKVSRLAYQLLAPQLFVVRRFEDRLEHSFDFVAIFDFVDQLLDIELTWICLHPALEVAESCIFLPQRRLIKSVHLAHVCQIGI